MINTNFVKSTTLGSYVQNYLHRLTEDGSVSSKFSAYASGTLDPENKADSCLGKLIIFIFFISMIIMPSIAFSGKNLTVSEAKHLIKQYYKEKGEWAGIFTMDSIEKIDLSPLRNSKIIASVLYKYIPVPFNSKGRTDSGDDERNFTLKFNGNKYIVTNMGEYNLGRGTTRRTDRIKEERKK